jgi:hypothetical protein
MFYKLISAFIIICSLLVFGFNNCSGVKGVQFSSLSERQFLLECAENSEFDTNCPQLVREQFKRTYLTSPTDILFILDDSCSMSTIATSMADGFSSLQSFSYPDNTLMGLTYMTPAKQDVNGIIDFATPFMPKLKISSPGYLSLVNKERVDGYLTDQSNHASYFPKKACNNEWFFPNEQNIDNQYCLDAASQLAPICTGIEAGLVSLEQVLKRHTLNGKRLFREGAFVNIILVSDTHEPGGNYFGLANAPERMKTYEELLSVINDNSPNVASLKISGILPLPVDGSPLYDGLNVIGDKPQTDQEAKVNGELFHNYSYLPYIKQTGGAVAHAKTNNWSGIAASIIDSSKRTGTLVVTLKEKPERIRLVAINGVDLSENDWSIGSTGNVISIKYSSPVDKDLDIDVVYEINPIP